MPAFLEVTQNGGSGAKIGLRVTSIDAVGEGWSVPPPTESTPDPAPERVTIVTLKSGLQVPAEETYDEVMNQIQRGRVS